MLLNQSSACLLGALKEAKYEEKIVKLLLRRYRIPDVYKCQMLAHSDRYSGTKVLTLALFRTFFPTFPMELATTYFPFVTREFTVANLFGRLDRSMLVLRYETLQESIVLVPQEPFGMVFHWPHLNGGGGLVLHNHPIDVAVPGSRLLWVSNHGEQLVLETLNVLLDTIDSGERGGKGWIPRPSSKYAVDW